MYGKAYFDGDSDSHISTGSRIKLKAPCPVEGCPNSNRIITWKCKDFGHDIYIYDDGYLGCEDRSIGYYGRIDKWRFNCGEHDFRYPSIQSLLCTISLWTEADEDFLRNLSLALAFIKFMR